MKQSPSSLRFRIDLISIQMTVRHWSMVQRSLRAVVEEREGLCWGGCGLKGSSERRLTTTFSTAAAILFSHDFPREALSDPPCWVCSQQVEVPVQIFTMGVKVVYGLLLVLSRQSFSELLNVRDIQYTARRLFVVQLFMKRTRIEFRNLMSKSEYCLAGRD